MTSTPRVPKAEITGLSGWLLKRLSRKHLGEVPEAAGVMWHNRPVLRLGMGTGGLGFRCIQPAGTDRAKAPPRGDALFGIAGSGTRRGPRPQANIMSAAASLVACARKTLSPAVS